MLRALGFNTDNVRSTIFLQALVFAVPGVCLGLAMASVLNGFVREFMFYYTQKRTNLHLSNSSILIGTLVGFVVPLGANYFPISHALSKNLRKSLDLVNRSNEEIALARTKLENIGISLTQFIIAILLLFLGYTCYYIAPISYLYRQFSTFFHVLNLLLVFVIVGTVFIATLLQPYLERAVAFCLVRRPFSNDIALFNIVEKNLRSHQKRNLKTAMMFSMVMAFLIFVATIFQLTAQIIITQTEVLIPADFVVTTFARDDPTYLDEINIA